MSLAVTPRAFVTVLAVVKVRVLPIQQLSLIWCSVYYVTQDTTQPVRTTVTIETNI